ncbi:MAG: thioesterase family protein [Candidatus Pelagadaptatus aseana]|uniref:acyl-CoA thioesterase n=1 Tax=Candidatus Pelagadaptatus aseana TaxID=3120508 RepID=UPI0039B32874
MTDVLTRKDFKFFLPITTRWMDNDIYGHVNNVTYYSYFDTVANTYLIEQGGLDIHNGDTIAFVVNSQCNYHSAVTYPEKLEGALRINRLGNSSVEYGIGIFRQGADEASANGTFTHVFVKRSDQRPTPIPDKLRAALEQLLV